MIVGVLSAVGAAVAVSVAVFVLIVAVAYLWDTDIPAWFDDGTGRSPGDEATLGWNDDG